MIKITFHYRYRKQIFIALIVLLLVASIVFGVAVRMSGEKGEDVKKLLESANVVIENTLKIVMYYAPIGLGCYMASMVGTFGATIAIGYAKTFVLYLVVSIAFYAIFYTVYAFIAGGKKGVVAFWKNVIPATVTALGTCSSAACIPVNIESANDNGLGSNVVIKIYDEKGNLKALKDRFSVPYPQELKKNIIFIKLLGKNKVKNLMKQLHKLS
mgnify:CR=1 FL=1